MGMKPIAALSTFTNLPPPWVLSNLDANLLSLQDAINDANTYNNYFVDQSTVANTITVSIPSGLTLEMDAGILIQVKIANTTTSSTVTVDVNSGGLGPVVNPDSSLPIPGSIKAGMIISLQFDGSVWQLQGGTGSSGSALFAETPAEATAGLTITNFTLPPGNVQRYGADPTGVTDSAPAFTAAFKLTGLVFVPMGNYLINSTVVMDISTTSLYGPANLISGLAAGAGTVLSVIASGTPEQNTKNTIRGIVIQGQEVTGGTTVAGVQGITFTGSTESVCCFLVSSCTFTGFADAAVVNTNAFEIQFHGCSFSQSGSDHAALYVHAGSSERVSCVQCQFFNNTECLQVDGGGEVFLDNCSLDYSYRLVNALFGNVYLTNCYFENGATVGDLDYWFKILNANDSTIVLQGGQISQTASKNNFSIGLSFATFGGGIYFRNVKFFSNTNGIVNPIIGGTGLAFASGCMIDGFSNNNVAWANFSSASNLCSNGTFVNALAGWTVATGAGLEAPTTPSNTLVMQVTVGGDAISLYWTVNAEPGQNIGFTCQVKGNTSACRFGMLISAVGADGVVIASSTPQETFNEFNGTTSPCPTAFTSVRALMFNLPAGTATVRFQLSTLGSTSNSNIVTVQNVLIGKY
jgi:hypothetical protein